MRHPASASCLGRHSHPAGRCPNSSSLFRPLAAVVAVAQGLFLRRLQRRRRSCSNPPACPIRDGHKTKSSTQSSPIGRGSCGATVDSQAAHLKRPRRGLFARRTVRRADAVRIHPRLWPQRGHIRKTPVYFYTSVFLVGAGGFEPPKLKAADLQSVPIGHSGTRPYSLFAVLRTACIYYHRFSSLSIFFVQIFRFLRCPAGSTPAPVLLARLFAYRSFVWLPAAFPSHCSAQGRPIWARHPRARHFPLYSKSRPGISVPERFFLELVTGVEPATH